MSLSPSSAELRNKASTLSSKTLVGEDPEENLPPLPHRNIPSPTPGLDGSVNELRDRADPLTLKATGDDSDGASYHKEDLVKPVVRQVQADSDVDPTILEKGRDDSITTGADAAVGQATQIDGGLRGWCTVLGAWLVQFTMVGAVAAYGATETFYAVHYLTRYSPSQINWIGSMQLFLQFSVGLVGGKLLDAGHFHVIAVGGSFVFLLSMFMLSLAQAEQYYQIFLAQGLGMGLGLGIIYMPSAGIVANHFTKRRGLAMGIITTGSSLGGFFFSTIFSHFLSGKIGFANGIRIGAYICLGCLIAANFLMHQHPSRPPTSAASPKAAPKAPPPPITSLLKKPSYTLTVLYGFVIGLGLYFPMFSVQLFAEDHSNKISPSLASWLLAIINISSTLGRVIPNWLSDRYGVLEMNIPCVALSGILALLMMVCTNPGSIVAFCILYGFFSGAAVALYFPAVLSLDPNMRSSGLRLGIACVPSGVASLIGTPIAAALVGSSSGHQRWWAGCVFAGVTEIFAAGLLVAALLFKKQSL